MSKQPLNEGIIVRTLDAIWTALLANKKERLLKALQKDPEFQASVERLDKAQKDLQKYVEEKQKKSSKYGEFEQWYNTYIRNAGR